MLAIKRIRVQLHISLLFHTLLHINLKNKILPEAIGKWVEQANFEHVFLTEIKFTITSTNFAYIVL